MNTVRVSRAAFSAADEIPLPQALNACAFVVKSETEGLWQKTLVVEFTERRRALSTNDGILDILSAVNHAAHQTIWNGTSGTVKKGHGDWMTVYMAKVREQTAQRLGVKTGEIALMGTAADLDNLAVATRLCAPFVVTALVTAGAKGNAIRTGVDAGNYIEPDPAVECISIGDAPVPGTVNIVLLTNARLSDGAMARAIITATEAKTAAFEDLRVPSSYTKNVQATGTGTDSMIVVSGTSGPTVTYLGGHSRIGELVGKAVHQAVMEALEKQNGFRRPTDDPAFGQNERPAKKK